MSKFDDMIHGLREEIEIPDDVWTKYTDTLSKLPDKKAKRFHAIPKRRLWPIAAAAVFIGMFSISAAAYIQWSKGLEQKMQISVEGRQLLESSEMVSFVGQSVTQGGVTVTAQQSIVDNYFAYLSFKIEGYEVEEGVQPEFSGMRFVVGDDGEFIGNWSGTFYDGLIQGPDGKAMHADGTPLEEGEKDSYTLEDGSMEYQVVMMSYEKGYFIDQPIHVELRDLGTYSEKAGDIAVDAEGVWSFDWVLAGSDEMKSYELETPLEESGATVLRAELSPISVSILFGFPREEETETGTDDNGEVVMHMTYADPPAFTGVRLKDGTIYTGLAGGGVSGYDTEDSDRYEYTASLKRVIDVEQVESLLFVKSYPEGERPLTEENLYIVPVE